MDRAFLNATFARPPRVLYRRLRPFTLGHWRLLCALDSPLAPYSVISQASLSELATAVWICAQPWDRALRRLRRLRRQSVAALLWGAACSHLDPSAEAATFAAYINAAARYPAKWPGDHDKPITLPLPWQIAYGLLGKWPEREVWAMPVADALLWSACQDERNGGRFVTDAERETPGVDPELARTAEEARAKLVAEGKLHEPG